MVAPSPIMKPPPATTGLGEKAADPNVMGAIKRQKGQAPAQTGAKMTPVQIIQDVMSKQGEDPKAAEAFLRNCDKLATMKLASFVQLGNTFFILLKMDDRGKPLPPGSAVMLPFTAEEDVIEQRLKVLPNTLRQLGFNRVLLKTNDQADIVAMQQAGLQPNVRQEMTHVGQSMVPMYSIEIKV